MPDTGTLEIVTATSGSEIDPDGYTIQLDGGAPQTAAVSGSTALTDIVAGEHSVQLGGLAGNCVVEGENPRPVTVPAGQTATVTFSVTCGASSGGLQVTTATTGTSPDADGYVLTVDGTERGSLPANGTLAVDGLAAGAHAIGLGGIAANCQVQGDNPQSATVTAGQAGAVSFAVVCTAPPATSGTLRIVTATTGAGTDSDGFSIAVDGGSPQAIAVNGSVSLANVAAGPHSVGLSGLAANCAVQGANPSAVTVAAGATAELRFEIICSGTGGGGGGGGGSNGSVQVAVTTTGSPVDPDGYTLSLDGGTPVAVAVSASHSFDPVPAGAHQVELGGIAANCAVADANPRPVTVTAGQAAAVAFAVTCGSSALVWKEMASGTDADLKDVWGSSGADVMAVGGSTILHFDGTAWSTQATLANVNLASVWGSSATSYMAVGQSGGRAAAYHYDGTSWSSIAAPNPAPEDPDAGSELRAVWGTSDGDVFAAGASFTAQLDYQPVPMVAHFDGSAWTIVDLPGISGGTLTDIYGTSGTNVIAVGTLDEDSNDAPAQGAVFRFDGTSWTEQFISSGDDETGIGLRGVWASSPTDVFVVGVEGGPTGSGGIIYHSNGSGFLRMQIPVTGALSGIWGTSPTDVYAVGDDGILHYDGQSWTGVDGHNGLQKAWGSSASDVFAVGDNGRILQGSR